MIEILLMLFGLAFSNNNANTTTANDNNSTTVTTQTLSGATDPGGSTGESGGSDTGGDTIQVPPKK
ncbi:hypothetical protein [Chryseobacterium arthrosphaerae]|uniref:hypothetical protein n=1 Tax=Chryseobacterium arthrosphaerae TaxID=651561 RepID=UPI001E341ABA|nr:hypothetical protein [Chryseobacterium arthrosphaerae]UEQ75004.1 hypothetical protein J8N07_15200 [Chryseobacterium arthrosphaerae]